MYNKVLNGKSKPCLQDLLSEQHHAKQLSVSYKFSVCSRFFVARASQVFLWYSQFFSESELRFSGNNYVIIHFQTEWPDRTSQVSLETVAFAVFCSETTYLYFLEKISSKFCKVMITCILAFLTASQYLIFRTIQYNSFL